MSLPRQVPFLLAALLLLQPVPARAAELLDNPELAGPPGGRVAEGWRDGSTALPQPPDCAIVPDGPGDRLVQRVILGPLQGGQCRLVQTVAPAAAGLYRLQAKLRVSAPIQVELVLRTATRAAGRFSAVIRETMPQGEWRELTGYARVAAPPGALGFVILHRRSGHRLDRVGQPAGGGRGQLDGGRKGSRRARAGPGVAAGGRGPVDRRDRHADPAQPDGTAHGAMSSMRPGVRGPA